MRIDLNQFQFRQDGRPIFLYDVEFKWLRKYIGIPFFPDVP